MSMTPSTPLTDRVLAIVPPFQRLDQADALDALADALTGGAPVDLEVSCHLRALASVLRCN